MTPLNRPPEGHSVLAQIYLGALFITRERRDSKSQPLKEPNRRLAGSSPLTLTDCRRLRRVLRKWADGSAKFPRYTSIHPLWHPFFFKHLGSVSQKLFFFFSHVAHPSNDKIAQRLSPKRAGVPPARHCEVCLRSSRTETVDSFLTRTQTRGKNESMSRGETWSNCSLPLSSWFPGITVVFLTFLALTPGLWFFAHNLLINRCRSARVCRHRSGVDVPPRSCWAHVNLVTDAVSSCPALPGLFGGWGGSVYISGCSTRGRGLDRMCLPTSRFALSQIEVYSGSFLSWGFRSAHARTHTHTHTHTHTNHIKQIQLLDPDIVLQVGF